MSMLLRRQMMKPKGGGGGLPSEYQQVAYLQSSGTQYIITGIECTSDLAVEFSFMCPTNVNAAFCGGIAPGIGSNYFRHHCSPESNDFRYWIQYNNSTSASVRIVNKWAVNTKYEVAIDPANGTATFNGEISTFTALQSGRTTGKNYGIFARIANDGAVQARAARIYYFKFYRNGNKVGDFVPCYRKSDNEPGMYDTVSGTFYTNAGSGTFTVGPSITFGKGQYTAGGIADNPNLFMVEIPVNWDSTSRNLKFRWSASGTLGNLGEPGLSALYMKNANGERVNYWAGTGEDGYRSVTASASNCASTKTVVFTGYLPDIQSCYVQDATNDIMLWQY